MAAIASGIALEEEDDTPEQLRSKSGVLLNVEPTIPKLGLGDVGKAS